MRVLIFLLSVALLQACKHPLAIRGEGDIVDLNGTGRGCSLEQFQAQDPACIDNEVIDEDYFVNYRAVPRTGWRFAGWEGNCGNESLAPDCRFDVRRAWVNAFNNKRPDFTFPTLTAVFEVGSGEESFPLFTAARWTFAWTHLDQSSTPDGNSSATYFGEFSLTLGNPSVLQGYLAYPVEISGELPQNINIEWQYLAQTDSGDLLGSFDGQSWVNIYRASGSDWSAGGFLYRFGGSINPVTQAFESDLNSYSAQVLGTGSSSSFCEIIAGVEVCGDEAGSLTVNEYYKPGVGPVALYFRRNVSDSGGGFFTSFTDTINLELVETNLAAADGTSFNRSPYRSLPALDPTDYISGFSTSYIRGMIAYGGKLWVFLSDLDDEAVLLSYDISGGTWQEETAPSSLGPRDTVLSVLLDGRFYAFINSSLGIEAWRLGDSGSWELESSVSASALSDSNLSTFYSSVSAVPGTATSSLALFTTSSHDDEVLSYLPGDPDGAPWGYWPDSELDLIWGDGSTAEAHSWTAASNGTAMYAVGGGRTLSEVTLDQIRRFFTDGTWALLAPMNEGRLTPAVAAVDGDLYVFGGDRLRRTGSFSNPWTRDDLVSAERYDTDTDSWSSLPDMPAELRSPTATSSGDAIYISRGYGRGDYVILEFTPQ